MFIRRCYWVPLEPEIGLYCCSNCEHKILRAECNYCPNCGKKMKKTKAKTKHKENYNERT